MVTPVVHDAVPAHPLENPIRIENGKRGTDAFFLKQPTTGGQCEIYCSVTSVEAGQTVDVFASVDFPQSVRLDLFRLGHYQGLGSRHILSMPTVAVRRPEPYYTLDADTGRVECDWPKTFSFEIDASWVTGYYLIKVTNDDGFEAHVPFIVRETGRRAPLLVQASVTTWQAYNMWGGTDLYSNATDRSAFRGPRGYQASFDRPYLPNANVWREEFAMVRFLEMMGYDVAYISNVDVDRAPELLLKRSLFMTVGHDEYWSLSERNAVQGARDKGLSIAFFSGNTAYRRIRLESSSTGIERRVVTCYKANSLDPHDNAPDTTTDFASAPFARPENELLGLKWAGWSHLDGFPFRVSSPDHWVYEGTGVQQDDLLGPIIGYEWDSVGDNGLTPQGLEVISSSPALHEYGYLSTAHAAVYYPTPESFVFASGTIAWSRALYEPEALDPRLQRMTENILKRAKLFPEASVIVPAPPKPEPSTSSLSRLIAGSGHAGSKDGRASRARFHFPSGIAANNQGELYVCDTGTNLIRKIAEDGTVSTFCGDRDKPGAHLSTPIGITTDALGVVYVADTNNHRILAITPDGNAVHFAGNGSGNDDDPNPYRARFHSPHGLVFDGTGALYVADFGNSQIRRIDANGVSTVATGCAGPSAIAIAPDGTLFYLSTWDGCIVRITPAGERTVIVNPTLEFGDRSGPGAKAALRAADGLLYTPSGLVVTDTGNNRVRFVAFDDDYTVTSLLGTGKSGSGIGTGSTTDILFPRGVCAYQDGFALTDSLNNRVIWC
ncbi:MAG: N,N-dimethylformamidase beta subunit family domain-containing protein, partial [Pseudomonadota bacterium]